MERRLAKGFMSIKKNITFDIMITKNKTSITLEKVVHKKLNIKKFLGLVKWNEDAVKYQRKFR